MKLSSSMSSIFCLYANVLPHKIHLYEQQQSNQIVFDHKIWWILCFQTLYSIKKQHDTQRIKNETKVMKCRSIRYIRQHSGIKKSENIFQARNLENERCIYLSMWHKIRIATIKFIAISLYHMYLLCVRAYARVCLRVLFQTVFILSWICTSFVSPLYEISMQYFFMLSKIMYTNIKRKKEYDIFSNNYVGQITNFIWEKKNCTRLHANSCSTYHHLNRLTLPNDKI